MHPYLGAQKKLNCRHLVLDIQQDLNVSFNNKCTHCVTFTKYTVKCFNNILIKRLYAFIPTLKKA